MKYTLLFLLLYSNVLFAQPASYDIAAIPDALKKDASTVKRFEKIDFEVKDIDKAYLRVQEVTTVLDASASNELVFQQFTDNFHSLEDVDIKVYDASGKVLDKLKKKDLSSQSSGSGLVPDGKVYYYEVQANKYPVTVEFDYTIIFHGIFHYPDYIIQTPEQSIERSIFTARVPKDLDLRFKLMNHQFAPVIDETDKSVKTYSWNISGLPAKKYEIGSGDYSNSYPRVMLGANKFELDGYPGEMNSWKNMGLWYNTLVKNDNVLDPKFSEEIKRLTSNATNERDKVELIYNYLQKNFRYVSIQLGIGGMKPFSADFVHKNKYGDCKALSNYMQACLNAVNIKGYSAWIRGDNYPNIIDPDFPDDPFNHQILCVPLKGDTIWLECTSNTAEFGVLGSFTENRQALLLTENGGVLLNTPKSKAESNRFTSNTTIKLNADGEGSASVELKTTGEYIDDIKNYVFEQKKDDQKKYLVNYIGFIQPDDFEITYDKADNKAPVKIEMAIEKVPEFSSGNKLFLNPRIYKIWSYALPKAEGRTQDFYFNTPFIKTDTTIYKLPEGFTLETLPKPKNINFEYGSLKSTYKYDEVQKTIITTLQLQLNEYKIPAAKFLATKNFFNEVLEEYTEKIVIKKS